MLSANKKKLEQDTINPDKIIEDLGGCGRFQVRMSVIVHVMKTIVCFSFTNMIIITNTPPWYCADDLDLEKRTSNRTYREGNEKACFIANQTRCGSYVFEEGLNTIVKEFHLVCDKDYLPSTINSIQVAGVLVGHIVAGQLADLYGRKPTLFASVLIILISQLVAYFSVSWQMFAICIFFVGLGGGFFLTTQYCILSEFSLAKWRAWIVGFPSWPIEACMYCLVGWLLPDWKHLQLCIIGITVPCFFAWFIIPESFRWYLAHNKPEKAFTVIDEIAKINKVSDYQFDTLHQKVSKDRNEIDSDVLNGQHAETNQARTNGELEEKSKEEAKKSNRKYSFIDLFRTMTLAKVTILQLFNWFALGLITYGIAFGIQTLSGNIFLNTFLFSLTGIPTKAIAIWMQNRFGRRISAIMCYVVVTAGAITVGIVQTTGPRYKNELTNAFAILANAGITTAWGPVQTMTIELYPTVIRNIGFGTLSLIGRVGAIAGPQLVYLDSFLPGLLFYVCGGISGLCIFASMFLPETKDDQLPDSIRDSKNIKEDLESANIDKEAIKT